MKYILLPVLAVVLSGCAPSQSASAPPPTPEISEAPKPAEVPAVAKPVISKAEPAPAPKTEPASAPKGGAKADANPATAALKTAKDKVSYIIGFNIGSGMKRDGLDIDVNKLAAGLSTALSGGNSQLPEAEVQAVMQAFQQEMQAKQQARQATVGAEETKIGQAFLAANKSKPGVKTTASGLQYQVIKAGTGKTPKLTDTVTTNYRGTLINGKEFDSSYKRGQPASFPVNGVIPGWTEALQLMKEGATWKLFIPSNLAYGPRGAGQDIPPNSALIFDIELIKIGK